MVISPNTKLFITGFFGGSTLLVLSYVALTLTESATAIINILLPRWWIFEANPVTLVLCNVAKSNLCGGLGFDGGPLVWSEILWLFVSPGILYGVIVLIAGNIIKRVRSSTK